METQKLYRGRLIDHIHLVTRERSASKRFNEAVLSALGISIGGAAEDYFAAVISSHSRVLRNDGFAARSPLTWISVVLFSFARPADRALDEGA